ncbi:MAG: hypothetical protein AAGA66_11500 [Bacteroidota bacterium]
MKKLLFLSFIISISCSQDKNTLKFAGFECWKLSENDKVENNQLYLDHYEQFAILDSLSIPLTKVIETDSLLIYIGLELTNTRQTLDKILSTKSMLSEDVGADYDKHFQKIGENFVLRYLYDQTKLNYVVLASFISKDSIMMADLYKKPNLINLLSCD